MVLLRVLGGEAFEGVDAAQANGEDFVAEHFGALLIALVKQALLGGVSLAFGYDAAPDCEYCRESTTYQKAQIADGRAGGGFLFTMKEFPVCP